MGERTGSLVGALGALRAFRGVAIAWFAVALLAIVAGLAMGAYRIVWWAGAERVEATVTRERPAPQIGSVRGSGPRERPTFAWDGPDGRSHVVDHPVASRLDDYRVGQRVALFVDPDAPDDYRIATFLGMWGMPLMLVLGGLLAAALAVPVLLFAQLFVMGARAESRTR